MRGRVQLIFKFLLIVVVLGILILLWNVLPIVSGYAAKVTCSGIFVEGRPQEQVSGEDLRFFPVNLARCTVDYQDSSVTASVLGLARHKAIYRWGLGATLVNDITEEGLKEQHTVRTAALSVDADSADWPQGDRIRPYDVNKPAVGQVGEPAAGGMGEAAAGRNVALRTDDTGRSRMDVDTLQLKAAIGKAFGEGSASTGTRAVVVVWHGQLIAERYASGYTRKTRMAGWSMTKGIVNALTGILVGEGKINTGAPAPVAAWEGDDRHTITVADLMHMNSGLRWWEFYDGPSDATDMLFKEGDMAAYAAKSGLRHPPGQIFNYSSGTADIICGIIRRALGDDYYYRFPYEQLFHKVGMYSAVLEPDASGTFVGSSYGFATARDWARFGLLYLRDGIWNGRRVLPEGWVKWTTTGTDYGALWWLNKGESGHRRHPNLPSDCFSCEGFEGQYIWVVPSMDLVVVRMAMEHGHRLDPDNFLPEVMKALH